VIAIRKAREADRGKDGKLVNGGHSAQAREHMLAASIAMSTGDYDEAARRIDSARIHTSHSQHQHAEECGSMLEDASTLLKNGNAEKANSKIDAAYGKLQGEHNVLLKMKKTRESDVGRKSFIETLTFHPKFLEGTYDPVKKTVDVLIVTEGMGNSRDQHFYSEEAIREAVVSKVFEGEQAYADHPSKFDDANRPERSVRDLIGYYFDSKLTETIDKKTGEKVAAYAAKFKIQEGLPWVEGIIREAIDFGKKFPDKTYVGISINADGDTVPTLQNGVEVNKVVRITEAFSADMVTKPARGGGFLRLVEGAGGAHSLKGESGMKALLDTAARLEKLAEGEEVDPATLKLLAKGLRESDAEITKGAGKAAGTEGSDDMLDGKRGTKDNRVGLNEGKKPEGGETQDGDADDEGDGGTDGGDADSKGDGEGGEDGQMTESQRGTVTNLREADLRKKYPSIFAAALREARTVVQGDVHKLRSENEVLRAEKAIRESLSVAKTKLKESKIPEGGFDRMLQVLVGTADSEMDDIISAEERYLESIGVLEKGGKRIGGNGERTTSMRESDVKTTTQAVIAGLTGD
jgi:hypothetical protein